MKYRSPLFVTMAVCAAVLLSLGCSSNATQAAAVDTSAVSAGLAKAKELTTKYSAAVDDNSLPKDANPVSPGKLIVTIPCSYAAENCKNGVDAFAEAAAAVGWTTKMIDPAGNPDKARSAVQTAINLGADGIFFMAGSGDALGPALADARSAGLATINVEGGTNEQGQFDTNIEPKATEIGRLLAGQMTVQSEGKGKILLVNDPEFISTQDIHASIVQGLKEFCPGCEVTDDINFQIADLSSGLPTQVQSALAAHPDTDTVWASYDAAASSILPVIKRSTKGDAIKMVSSDGLQANLADVRDGGIQSADVASSTQWMAYQSVDEMDHILDGGAPTLNINTPYKLMTAETITSVPWNGDVDWKSAYLTRWGK